ncbi:hypothetical protein UVI_02008660 [Ustilaginoidea virens]|nr:hypothetical protein UVI_02008660 [Ustilaginoidea virens]
MSWRSAPRVDFDHQPEYQWPAWLADHSLEDLFGELHDKFSTIPIFIQDPIAFHTDVAQLAGEASSRDDFLAALEERKNQRLEELR